MAVTVETLEKLERRITLTVPATDTLEAIAMRTQQWQAQR